MTTSASGSARSLRRAAATGDQLKTLIALRNTLAAAIDDCESLRDLAALSARMVDVLSQIAELVPAEQKGDVVDEIARRRAARRSGAAKSAGGAKL